MKPGDKFRVFEVTEKQPYTDGCHLIGKQFVEQKGEYLGNKYGIDSPFDLYFVKDLHFTIGKSAKPIGQLIIKKVK